MGDKIRGGVSARRSRRSPPRINLLRQRRPGSFGLRLGVSTGLGQIRETSFPALMSGTINFVQRRGKTGTETETFCSVLTRSSIITIQNYSSSHQDNFAQALNMLQHCREAVWFLMLLNASCKGDFESLTSRTRPHGRLIVKQPMTQEP